MVTRPKNSNPFEFVVVSALRAQQLLAGSTPRLEGDHGAPTMAQMEVAGGHVFRMPVSDVPEPRQCIWQI
jgi:DNA-directed RNA polymerase subunit K/omega